MKKIIGAVALAIAVPAAAYAQSASTPAAKPDKMQHHAECMKMHGMMTSMMHRRGAQAGHSPMQSANGQAHQQMMTPGGNGPAAGQLQQHQQ